MTIGPNERLERSQWDFFWVPEDVDVLDRPEVAAVRSEHPNPHLNMVTRTRMESPRLGALVREMGAWFGRREARWLVPDTVDRRPLEAALSADGWAPAGRYEARAIRPEGYVKAPPRDVEVRRVESAEVLRDCVAVTGAAFGRDMTLGPRLEVSELAQCQSPAGRVHRYVVYRDGRPICSGGFNWYPDLRFAFLWAGGTAADARGGGAYTALVHARVQAAAALGAEWVGLYAKDDTSAPIVARQGFEPFGEMTYWGRAGGE